MLHTGHTGNLLEQSTKKPRLAAPIGSGDGIVGPAVSGESENAAPPPVNKQEEQMLRVTKSIGTVCTLYLYTSPHS